MWKGPQTLELWGYSLKCTTPVNGSCNQKKWLLIQCNIHRLNFLGFNWETEGEGDSTLKSHSEPESMCPLNQLDILETALEMTCFSVLAVKLIKPWTPEIFLECLPCYDYSHWISGHASKPQSHNHCCSQFSIPTPDWLLPFSTVIFKKYFWCSQFMEFLSNFILLIQRATFSLACYILLLPLTIFNCELSNLSSATS